MGKIYRKTFWDKMHATKAAAQQQEQQEQRG